MKHEQKTKYNRKIDAVSAAAKRSKYEPFLRPYKCHVCNAWHLTKQPE